MAFMLERQGEFPGVEPEREFLREYPHGVSARTCSARSAR